EGVTCSFFFQTRNFDKHGGGRAKYLADRTALDDAGKLTPQEGQKFTEDDSKLSEEYGYFEKQGIDVTDYHTQYVDIPVGLFKNALDESRGYAAANALTVRVRCESPTQFVGMARYHLYLRQDNPEGGGDTLAFAINFYKGSLGLWLQVVLVVGLCVFLSTQLGGITSFL